MSDDTIDVEMPDGTVITGVPQGTTQKEVWRRYGLTLPAAQPSYKQETARQQFEANQPVPTAATGLQNLGESIVGSIKNMFNTVGQNIGRPTIDKTTPWGYRPSFNAADAVKGAFHGVVDPVTNYISSLVAGKPDQAATAGGQILTQTIPAVYGTAEGAAKIGIGAKNAIQAALPNEARAGANLEAIKQAAGNVPIDTGAVEAIAARAQELRQRGASMPKVINDFIKNRKPALDESGAPIPPDPMTYNVGRDFASNAGRLSADEASRMIPPMKAQVAQFAQALKDANREAAVKVGMGDLYDSAIKEYRNAKTISDAKDILKKYSIAAIPYAAKGLVIGGAAYGIGKALSDK